MRFIGIFNGDGGTFRTLDMDDFVARAAAVFGEAGHELDSRVVSGKSLLDELERAAADPGADVVLAGGGDGTLSAAAAVCFRLGKPLAVLPAGTMNLFARTLRVPLDLEEALHAVAGGRYFDIDIATANGRAFVEQFSVGLHARLVRIREEQNYASRWQKIWAGLRSIAGAVSKPLRFQVDIVTPRGSERRLASGMVVSNNLIAEGHLPHADNVDGGVLGVYLVKPMSRMATLRLIIRVLLGHWKGHPRVSEAQVTEVKLTFPRRKRSARAVIDGELVPLEALVDLRIHPRALTVFAPHALADALQADAAQQDPAPQARNGALTA